MQFKARAPPKPLGSCESLDLLMGTKTSTEYGTLDPHDGFKTLLKIIQNVAGYDLFEQPSWRRVMSGWVDAELEVSEAFDSLKWSMCDGLIGEEDECASVRAGLLWLLENDLRCMAFLLENGIVPSGGDRVFPEYRCDDCPYDIGSEDESLLGIAVKYTLPDAVKLLLSRGADPNGELVHLVHNDGRWSTAGPASLACMDVRRNWFDYNPEERVNHENDKIEIMKHLANAGGEMWDAFNTYSGQKGHEVMAEICGNLFDEEMERKARVARIRLETVVGLVAIISFWRREAAAPDSVAAMKAVRRARKLARLN